MSEPNASNLFWVDMEMTGLNPEVDHILEVASVVTDAYLNIIAEGPDIVVHQSETVLKNMHEWSQKQHAKSGLTDAVRASKITLKEAEQQTLAFAKQHCLAGGATLCGNAVHHDRRFIIKHMRMLDEFCHYRLVDVSTVKVLVGRWYPKDKNLPPKGNTHRALTDIKESIEELRYYREHYFRPSES